MNGIADIAKLGGRVAVEEQNPDKPVIGVDLSETEITDAGLVYPEGLAQLESLDLGGLPWLYWSSYGW